MKSDLYRLRFAYPKSSRLAFLSHLELSSTIGRSIRRAGLPFAVSQGFARRMRIQFTSALPVGVSSKAEYFDLFLSDRLDAGVALERLSRTAPAALRPFEARYVEGSLPALEAWLDRSSWLLDLGPGLDGNVVDEAIAALCEQGSFTSMRGEKEKMVDVRAGYVAHGTAREDESLMLGLETLLGPNGALRPEAFIRAAFACIGHADALPRYLRCERTAQYHLDDGTLVDPFQLSSPQFVD